MMAALTTLVAVGGCLDNSLDIVNPNEATLESFWQTEPQAIAAGNSVYFIPYTRGMWGRNRYWMWGRTDAYMSRSPASAIQNAVRGIITDYNYGGFLSGMWDDPWAGIFRANQVLARVPEMDINQAVKTRIVAETKFLRGLFYFHQTLLFGDIPIITEPADASTEMVWKPKAEALAQVVKDAGEAAQDLPWTWSGADKGRATKGGALALLAEAYMHQGKWSEAATALQQIVDSNQYQLLANYANNWRIPEGEQSAESLFEVAFGDINAVTAGVYGNINPRLIAPSSGAGSSIGFNDIQPNDWAFMLFFEGPGLSYPNNPDPRLDATIFWNKPGGMDVFGMPFAQRYRNTGPGGGPGFRDTDLDHTYFWKKYQEYWKTQLTDFANPINFKVYRLGQIYVMLGEARAELGQLGPAKAAIDVIRARAGVQPMPSGLSADSVKGFINHEDLRENMWEGHGRLSYLKRHGFFNKAYLTPRNPFHAALFDNVKNQYIPIPQAEMNRNPNAVQNAGW
jgi:hypothetical protein